MPHMEELGCLGLLGLLVAVAGAAVMLAAVAVLG
jgi:hypothetical protein